MEFTAVRCEFTESGTCEQTSKNSVNDFDVRNQTDRSMKIGFLSGVLVTLITLGIILIGVRELFYPSICARQFGVPLLDPHDADFLAIKAARES